jgi:hypothetical protein
MKDTYWDDLSDEYLQIPKPITDENAVVWYETWKIRNKDLLENYRTKYSVPVFGKYAAFKPDWELTKDFTFFCDFKDINRYKIWNYAFNGYYPELFIKD